MLLFVGCIVVLYFLSLLKTDSEISEFSKDKTAPVKGIMAILIVFHHLSLQGIKELDAFSAWGAPIVSIFFFMSGYGLYKSFEAKGRAYLANFFGHRILNSLVLPFIIALIIYSILNWNHFPGLVDSLENLFFKGYTVLPHSWYVFAILIFYISFYIVARFLNKRFLVVGITVISLLYILWCFYWGFDRCWYISSLAFSFGVLLGKYENKIHKLWLKSIIYYITVPICLALTSLCVFVHNEALYMFAYILIPFIFLCLFAKVKVEVLGKSRIILFISGISYEIYLCQGISMDFLRGDIFYILSDWVYIFCTLGLVIILAFFVKYLRNRILGNSI